VRLEEALEVENSYLLRLRYGKKLTKSGIRVDVLLVVELLVLDVRHNATGDIRAAHQRTLGLTKEDAEGIRDLLGLREDRGLLRDLNAVGIKLRSPSTAPAASTLELASQALLHLLHISKYGAKRVTELIHARYLRVKLGNKVYLALRLGISSRRGNYRGGYRRSYGSGGGGLAALGGRGSGNRGRGNSRCHGLRICGGLRGLRGGGLLCDRIRAHFILVTGFI